MKFLGAQLTYLLNESETRRNLQALLRYLVFLTLVVVLFSVVFHWIMVSVEGRQYSWVTGFYWTLTVMSTLGFGDITFHSDLGRLFSVVVLLSGIVLLLIVLPFAFIRFFYAPWLEAQIRLRAPREVARETSGHVVVASYDGIAEGLIRKLGRVGIPCFVLEPDPQRAARLHSDGVPVVNGAIDAVATYEALRIGQAKALFTNLDDATNTNVTLTAREASAEVPVIALAEKDDSVDLLELAGATHVVPLKRNLGEHLATRVSSGHAHTEVLGKVGNLLLAEFPVHGTPLEGKTIRETKLRQAFGLNVVGVWERGRLLPAHPDQRLSAGSVPVVVGSSDQLLELDTFLVIYFVNFNPIIVMGGGRVGSAACLALKARGMAVHLVEQDPAVAERLQGVADEIFVGDAADREVLLGAGLGKAPSAILTTNDDATNIYLAVYCRRLNPGLRIVSRITHDRNIEAIHRAGADLALSYDHLAVETVYSHLRGRDLVLLGQGVDYYTLEVPRRLAGQSLAASGLRSRTGLNVLGFESADGALVTPSPDLPIPATARLVALGTAEQVERFNAAFG